MLKYLWNRGQNPTSEREKLQKELFSFSKNVEYGFPNKPLSMDYDPHLHLLVIITKSGLIRIFGQPGVELSGHLANKELGLVKVLFLPGQGRLITLAQPGNVLHFWEIEDNKIEKVRDENQRNYKYFNICIANIFQHFCYANKTTNNKSFSFYKLFHNYLI